MGTTALVVVIKVALKFRQGAKVPLPGSCSGVSRAVGTVWGEALGLASGWSRLFTIKYMC